MSGARPRPDLAAALEALRESRGQTYWRSLEELFDAPEFRRRIATEFPALARTPADVDRRSFFKCLAASIALAGLDGCQRQADEDAWPLVRMPEGSGPGTVRHYATAWELDGVGQPVIGTCRDGRPIKLEGNPDHPASRGATDAFTQASLLGLYDPARSGAPTLGGEPSTWDTFAAAAQSLAARLDTSQGAGFRLLTGPVGSPTLLRQIAEMRARWPAMGWHVHDPLEGLGSAPGLRLDAAHAVVCLDADPLGNGPRQTWHARGWSTRRRAFQDGDGGAGLMVAEPTPTLTGATAGERLPVASSRIAALLGALAAALGEGGPAADALTPEERRWTDRAARLLAASRGQGLLLLGGQHPPAMQALAAALNRRLGNQALVVPRSAGAAPDGALAELAQAMARGEVDALLVLEANPVYASAPGLGFARALERVPLRIHAGLHRDETALACHWHLPTAHLLESWSDVRCADGSASLVQPLVRPFLDVRSRHEVMALIAARGPASGREIVRATWPATDTGWQAMLVKGVAEEPLEAAGAKPEEGASLDPAAGAAGGGLELIFRPDPTVHDGSLAANPWLQELPKPLTKLTWDNAVHIAPQLAGQLGVANGDLVTLSAGPQSVTAPVWIVPGQDARTILIHLGYGRPAGSAVAQGCGFDAYALRSPKNPWLRNDVTIRKAGGTQALACTQTHWAMDGHDWVRTVEGAAGTLPEKPANPSFYAPQEKRSPAWGMAIDLDLCIGCNACAVACVAENNVPMVGKEQVEKGRAMHWLRVDRYYEGSAEEPRHAFQPVPCMHCEDAPCEMGCPVNAAVHSPDGLNLQVYNRCIGTRTCSAYCPYKVRRFNWLDYTREAAPELVAQRNPEVTVRDRGVMEKCTYCVQRITDARIAADNEGRGIAEGEVRTACQQACPTDAIVFGDIARPDSAVSRRKASGRDYSLIEEANTRPRTTYGARIVPPAGEEEA